MCASSWCCLPCLECLDLSDQSDLDDIKDVVDYELLLLSKHSPGKVKGAKMIETSGLSSSYYILSLWRAGKVTLDSQNCNLQTHLSEGKF